MKKRTFLVVFGILALLIFGIVFLNASGQAEQGIQPGPGQQSGKVLSGMKADATLNVETGKVFVASELERKEKSTPPGFANIGWVCPISGFPAWNKGEELCRNFTGTMMEMIAEELEMTLEELFAERFAGKSLSTIAEGKGMSLEEMKDSIMKKREKLLEELVKNGTISETQKKALEEHMESRLETVIERFETVPARERGFGKIKGFGRPGADEVEWFRKNRHGNCFR